jgi:hypothetical protein
MSLPQFHYSCSGSLSTTVYSPNVEEGRDLAGRHAVSTGASYGDGGAVSDGASDG